MNQQKAVPHTRSPILRFQCGKELRILDGRLFFRMRGETGLQ